MRRAVPAPVIFTRRAFLQRTAAAGAFIAAGGLLGACTDDGPADPVEAGSPGPPLGEPPDTARIVRVAVHPAVGIGRVGNSADSFYFGPEIPLTPPIAPDGFKDAAGAMARQAARFRVYGYDDQGDVVKELTAADGTIAWTVSVANKKAAWYDFDTAMDIPVAGAGQPAQRGRHRCRPGPAGRRLGSPDDQRRRRHAGPARRRPVPGRAGASWRVDDG